jgi:hypothetical protein
VERPGGCRIVGWLRGAARFRPRFWEFGLGVWGCGLGGCAGASSSPPGIALKSARVPASPVPPAPLGPPVPPVPPALAAPGATRPFPTFRLRFCTPLVASCVPSRCFAICGIPPKVQAHLWPLRDRAGSCFPLCSIPPSCGKSGRGVSLWARVNTRSPCGCSSGLWQ